MRALASQRERAARLSVELSPPLDQLAHVARPRFDQHVDSRLIAQTIACADRVCGMSCGRVVWADGGRDAPLGVPRAPLRRLRFGKDHGVAGIRQLHRGPHRRDTAPHNQKVALDLHIESSELELFDGQCLLRELQNPALLLLSYHRAVRAAGAEV